MSRSCGVLPMAFNLLHLGDSNNPLHPNRFKKTEKDKAAKYALKLAKMVARYRDSTYLMNFNLKLKFVKIGESGMDREDLKENVLSVLSYGLSMIPNGGVDNVLRLSLHINHTDIQLTFYVNLDPWDGHFNIVNPTNVHCAGQSVFARKRKQIKLKKAMKKNCNKTVKHALIHTIPIRNLTALKFVKQCNKQ